MKKIIISIVIILGTLATIFFFKKNVDIATSNQTIKKSEKGEEVYDAYRDMIHTQIISILDKDNDQYRKDFWPSGADYHDDVIMVEFTNQPFDKKEQRSDLEQYVVLAHCETTCDIQAIAKQKEGNRNIVHGDKNNRDRLKHRPIYSDKNLIPAKSTQHNKSGSGSN